MNSEEEIDMLIKLAQQLVNDALKKCRIYIEGGVESLPVCRGEFTNVKAWDLAGLKPSVALAVLFDWTKAKVYEEWANIHRTLKAMEG